MYRPLRRGLAALTPLAVTAAGLAVLGVAAAAPSQAETVEVDAATFTWGLSGYAQRGIFGPWTYKNLTGNVTQLVGSVTTGATNTQTEYLVDPVPATSMPPNNPAGGEQKTPNAVKFTLGEGTTDPATGAATLSWDGSYTVNAYPAQYGAPDEIYSDPQLTVDADGDGEVTMNFALGAGQDMSGNPVPAQDFGRLTLMSFRDGSAERTAVDAFRYTPDYQGVEVTVPDGSAQTRSCTPGEDATGWWGSWPAEFVDVVPSSVRPHFYSTGCGGMQDFKPPLPLDVDLGAVLTPEVTVSDTSLLPDGTQQVTVTGTGFDPALAVGTRPPFSGKKSGLYIAFGRYLDFWRPSQTAPSGNRKNPASPNGNGVGVKWAVPAESFPGSGQDPTSPAYTELRPDGSFEATISVNQAWLASEAGNFGIYTYAGGGPTVAAYETATPLTFAKAATTVVADAPGVTLGSPATVTVDVASEGGTAGTVTLSEGAEELDSEDVVGGSATFTLDDLEAGTHTLTATYGGSVNSESGSDTVDLVVSKHASSATARAPQVRYGQRPAVVVTVASSDGEPTGTVTLRRGNAVLGTSPVTDGRATFTLARLAAGTHALTASFGGNDTTAASTAGATLRVVRAATTTRVALSPRPTRTAPGRVAVSVSSPTTTPTGRVTVRLTKAGRTVRTLSGPLSNGRLTRQTARLAAGTYRVAVTYAGNANVAGSTRTTTLTVR